MTFRVKCDIISLINFNILTMKTDKNFKIDRTVKRFLTTMSGESKSNFKKLMIDAQGALDSHKRAPLRKDKKDKVDEA